MFHTDFHSISHLQLFQLLVTIEHRFVETVSRGHLRRRRKVCGIVEEEAGVCACVSIRSVLR